MIKKNKIFPKILLVFILICLYFFTRIQNLTSIPVFGDEAIYIRWSQIIKNVETLRFIPQTDGKQPLFMWFTAVILRFFSDPLIAGRLISVSAGFGTLIGIFLTICILVSFHKNIQSPLKFFWHSIKENFYYGVLAVTIYILLPFSFFFDRLALPDNTLSLFGIWSILFSFLLAKFKRLDLAFILGVILGLAWLTKSPALYFVILSLITFIFLNLKNIKSIYLPIISSIIAYAIYNILRLGPQFQMIAVRNKDYIWPIGEILKHPFDPLKPHIGDIFTIFGQFISWPVLVLAIIGFFLFLFYKKNTHIYLLICWWILPLIADAAIAKVFTARYILYTLPPLIILLSLGLSVFFKRPLFKFIFIIIIFIPNIIWIKNISLNPFSFNLPNTEKGYLQDWTSGWGIKQSADFFKTRSLQKNVIVGTEGSFGTLPDGLQIYTDSVKQLTVIGLGLGFTQIPSQLIDAHQHGDEVYLLINQSRFKISSLDQAKLTLIKSFTKPNQDRLLLYQL